MSFAAFIARASAASTVALVPFLSDFPKLKSASEELHHAAAPSLVISSNQFQPSAITTATATEPGTLGTLHVGMVEGICSGYCAHGNNFRGGFQFQSISSAARSEALLIEANLPDSSIFWKGAYCRQRLT